MKLNGLTKGFDELRANESNLNTPSWKANWLLTNLYKARHDIDAIEHQVRLQSWHRGQNPHQEPERSIHKRLKIEPLQ